MRKFHPKPCRWHKPLMLSNEDEFGDSNFCSQRIYIFFNFILIFNFFFILRHFVIERFSSSYVKFKLKSCPREEKYKREEIFQPQNSMRHFVIKRFSRSKLFALLGISWRDMVIIKGLPISLFPLSL